MNKFTKINFHKAIFAVLSLLCLSAIFLVNPKIDMPVEALLLDSAVLEIGDTYQLFCDFGHGYNSTDSLKVRIKQPATNSSVVFIDRENKEFMHKLRKGLKGFKIVAQTRTKKIAVKSITLLGYSRLLKQDCILYKWTGAEIIKDFKPSFWSGNMADNNGYVVIGDGIDPPELTSKIEFAKVYDNIRKNNPYEKYINLLLIFFIIMYAVFIYKGPQIIDVKNSIYRKISTIYTNIDNYIIKRLNLTGIRLNKYAIYIVIVIIFGIASMINVHGNHDWGDDFAQYISQAKNISYGIDQKESNLILDKDTESWGAAPYVPPGFPLILAFTYLLYGNSIFSFQITIAIFYLLICLLLFDYYNYNFKSYLSALLLTCALCYNPWLIDFKKNILSDLPYIFFSLLSLYYIGRFYKNNIIFALCAGILCGFAWTIRPTGVALIASVVIYGTISAISSMIRNDNNQRSIFYYSGYVLIAVFSIICYWFITDSIFQMPNDFLNLIRYVDYTDQGRISFNSLNYADYVDALFPYIYTLALFNPIRHVSALNLFLFSLMLCGFAIKIRKGMTITDVFVIMNIIMIVYVKVHAGSRGTRYILPILPFLIEYIYIAFDKLFLLSKSKFLTIAIVVFIMLSYLPIISMISKQAYYVDGPQTNESIECFDYINKNIKNKSVIIFFKPRALGIYTDNLTHPPIPFENVQEAENKYDKLNAEYLLLYSMDEQYNLILKEFIKESKRVRRIWNNHDFALYKYDKHQ
ncbi:MAG: hypothetical protein CSYNP_01683 [Syntrophus sp. SKADARSKE-3]|nr:hypothetical protein [Syntrophus sp. SKADARSKE-3]